jgi:hypothetical protein
MGGRVPVSPGRGRQTETKTHGETMEEAERCADILGEGKAEPGGMTHAYGISHHLCL